MQNNLKSNACARKAGFALPVALLIMSIVLILIPMLVQLNRDDSKKTVQENRKATSFHLAEAGLDRGVWKIRESDSIWENIMDGTIPTNYAFDKVFDDIDGGQYKILISSGPGSKQVTIISKGLSTNGDQVRAIEAVYSRGLEPLGAMSAQGAIEYRPNLTVHWGPVVSYTSIDQSPSQYYPRKYSAGQIVGRDVVNDSNNGAMPAGDWATYDYTAFYDLGNAPEIDLDELREQAQLSCVPTLRRKTGAAAAAHTINGTCDTGYYTEEVKIQRPGGGSTTYDYTSSTSVIFIEAGIASFPWDAFLDVKALVAIGDCDFNARSATVTATIPTSAQDEYQKSTEATTFWTAQGWTAGGTTNLTGVGMRGFLYCEGDMANAGGGSVLNGAIFVKGDILVNTLTIYYDEDVAEAIPTTSDDIVRDSWDEIVTGW